MHRLFCRTARRCLGFSLRRSFSSPASSSSSGGRNIPETSAECANKLKNSDREAVRLVHHLTPISPPPSSVSRISVAALISAIVASGALILTKNDDDPGQKSSDMYSNIEHAIERSRDSAKRIINKMKQTGIAASVLWTSLRSILSSANNEFRSGFELRVAALLADISAANPTRRAAIVGAGGGAVVDWLLDTVAVTRDNSWTQAESARALAYLIADPSVSGAVLGRPHAVPNLLRFIFSAQPQQSKKPTRHSSFDVSDSLKGKSMLVAAIMDIVTSNCDSPDKEHHKPLLPGNAKMRDIAAAIEVIEEGGLHLDEPPGNEEDETGGKGIRGIGIKVLGGTTVLGLSRTHGLMESLNASQSELVKFTSKSLYSKIDDNTPAQVNLSSVVPGLWDDLHSQHVAVPFAAWALADWAMASDMNRSHIQELDRDGHAIMSALLAPERSVKWHGSLVARLLLEDRNLPLNDSVSDWSSSLLSIVSQASISEDIPMAQMALSAFLLSIERSSKAQMVIMKKGLHLMREAAKKTMKHKHVQEALAKGLELLCTGDLHLSLDESQKWSGILLPWVFGKLSSDAIQCSAVKILSCILEDYGPSSIPISQGWLALMLTDILDSRKKTASKGNAPPRSDKVKTQIDQANMLSATQTAHQLASAVVSLAASQLGNGTDSDNEFPLADLLSLYPLAESYKYLNKDHKPKFNAADSAIATLKGIKALTEICNDDSVFLDKITDFGILCLLRRFLLQDDYEKLAAIEAYEASRTVDAQEQAATVSGKSSVADTNDSSIVRVPPSAHIRRHAARLLTILSALPKVREIVMADETWCNWLEDCARGKIPGCSELKIQSYARATLLNIFCNDEITRNSIYDNGPDNNILNKIHTCPLIADMIFLINPELPHWKCPEKLDFDSKGKMSTKKPGSLSRSPTIDYKSGESKDGPLALDLKGNSSSKFVDGSRSYSQSEFPPLDVVFVHGLRGGPFKTWRVSEDKSSTKSGLVEKIDEEAGKQGTFWPGEWLSADFPHARIFSIKYKTNLTQWSGASLPLQEVSSMLLEKLLAAGIGDRPVVFVTHSMGGLVVKQMLHQAKAENKDSLVDNTIGVVFYSCPHFGSRLADMPWRMGLVFRPAPSIGELRSGSPRLIELNDFVRHLHKKGVLEVLSFCETKVTPIVEGYGGWAFRMEIVSIESAYPGFGEIVVLESTDHVNSCKPLSRTDPSYREILEFLQKLKARYT